MGTGWWRRRPRLRPGGSSAGLTGEGSVSDGPPGSGPTGGGLASDGSQPGAEPAEHETAELTQAYWRAYDQRLATVGFSDVARRFPALVGQAVGLGWSANRLDTASTIGLNLASGVFGGYALFATTGVLDALFAGGPTPHRVRAALPSLILVAVATAVRSARGDGSRVGAESAGAPGRPGRRGAAV